MAVNIIPRNKWGARPPQATYPLEYPVPRVYSACTYTENCNDKESCTHVMRGLQNKHLDVASRTDIRFNFVIGGNGVVYEGRGWTCRPELPRELRQFNSSSIYIAYVGYFKHSLIPESMKMVLRELIKYGQENYYIELKSFYKHLILPPSRPREEKTNYTQEEHKDDYSSKETDIRTDNS